MTSILSLGPDAQRQVREQLQAHAKPPTPTPKYKNRKTVYRSTQGFERCYDSKFEARTAAYYDHLIQIGMLRCWVPQVPFLLPGGVRLVVDFMLMWTGGEVTFADAKGRETQASINKRKQVKAIYGVDVEIVTK